MVSERQFAKLVGSSLSVVQDRRKAGRLPKSATQDEKGRWRIDPKVGLREWEALAPARITGRPGAESLLAWREARARREAALAGLAEDELRKGRGELLEAAGVEKRLVDVFGQCKTKLLGIPSRLRQRCPHLALTDLAAVEELIREALESLAVGPRGK